LARLVHQKSLYTDATTEIDRLSNQVKSELSSIEDSLSALDHVMRTQLARASNSSSAEGRHARSHSAVVVESLKSNLGASAKSFIGLLETRTKNLKSQSSRRKEFEHLPSTATLELRSRQRGSNRFDALLHEAKSDSSSSSSGDLEASSRDDDEVSNVHAPSLLAFDASAQDTSYHASRAEAVETIESTIHELGSMYQRITSLIAMQDETIVRIDDSLEMTQQNIEMGHNELLKYFDNLSSNRALILKVFGILIAFMVFFMVFVA